MNYQNLVADSDFSSHAIASAHRACGCQSPPDFECIWTYLNDRLTPHAADAASAVADEANLDYRGTADV